MSVYKDKKSEFYTYDFWFKNRRYKDVTDATTKAEALKVEAHVRDTAKAEFKLGKRSSGDVRITFKEATARYNHEVARHLEGQGPNIVLRDLERLEDWVTENIGPNALLTDITDDEITKLVSWRRGQRVKRLRRIKGKKELQQDPKAPFVKPATVNRSTTELLKKIFIRARNLWTVHFEKWPTWKGHFLKANSEVINDLQEGQGEALMEATRDDYAPAIEFEHVTGWRQGAVIGLEWEHVNWGAKTIRFPAKPGKKERTIEINADLRAILWPLRGHDPRWVFTYVAKRTTTVRRKNGADKVVAGKRYHLTPSGFKTTWRRSTAKAGLWKFRNHDLRHDFATKLYDETGDIYAVQDALGHADVKTTMRYVHRRKDRVNAAIVEIGKTRLRKVVVEKSPPKSPLLSRKAKKSLQGNAA